MPREHILPRTIARALLRARLIASAEAAAAGAAVAAWWVPAGFAAAVAFAAWRGRQTTRPAVLRMLERADPRSRNLIVTADELASGALVAKPEIRQRVEADAASVLTSLDPASVFSIGRLAALAVAAVVAWTVAGTIRAPANRRATPSQASMADIAGSRPSSLRVTVTVEPPAYTHLQPIVTVDPAQIEAVEHAIVRLSIATTSERVMLDASGDVRQVRPGADGRFEDRVTAGRSGYLLITTAGGPRRLMPLTVTPDVLPVVTMAAPARDLVYSGGNPSVSFATHATDDFGLRALTLRYTKVSGSGEQFEFKDGEIPLAIARSSDRDWKGSVTRSISELGLAEGDMLVYRAVASDMSPGGVEASSDAFYIEMSRLGVAAGDAFTLPEQETRYALSQQMLIVKTDRLNQRRQTTSAGDFTEASQSLAVEQRMIRSEFVFMLGGEIEDEEVEAEQSVEIQAGRLVNRGQRDIRAATIAMSQAEKLLTGANTVEALKAERAAVEALQRAFARDRYILRALASRSQLDVTRRLTGSMADALGWRRLLIDVPANRRAALLQDLLQGLGSAQTGAERDVLAELAVRIDPASTALRQVVSDLQKLSDEWDAMPTDARRRRIDSIAGTVAAEARRALADPAVPIGGAR